MTIVSVSLGTMGMVLDDTIVVVGAMLIAPMMNPVVLLGFAICRANYRELLSSIQSIAVGALISILVSFLIIKISPIHEITPQILSKIEPNIYHLLIALFSGVAGTYTKIKRKGKELIGFAISTSLMLPLSVVGFSIAIGNKQMGQETVFLFLTNLVAIALSGTLLARWYGFGSKISQIRFMWQISAYLIAIIILSIPLMLALKEAVYEVSMNRTIVDRIDKSFNTNKELTLIKTNFSSSKEKLIKIRAVVFTNTYKKDAQQEILDYLRPQTDRPIQLTLEQVLYANQENMSEDMSLKSSKNNIIDKEH